MDVETLIMIALVVLPIIVIVLDDKGWDRIKHN